MCIQHKSSIVLHTIITLALCVVSFSIGSVYADMRHELAYRPRLASDIANVTLVDTGADYAVSFPASYAIESKRENFPVKTIRKGMIGKIEIFKMKDFGERPFGFEPETEDSRISEAVKQIERDNYVPKEQLTVGPKGSEYNVWLYYNVDDTATKNELHEIVKSFTF